MHRTYLTYHINKQYLYRINIQHFHLKKKKIVIVNIFLICKDINILTGACFITYDLAPEKTGYIKCYFINQNAFPGKSMIFISYPILYQLLENVLGKTLWAVA